MNKIKIEIEKRKVLNKLNHNSLSGNKEGSFNIYASETEDHIRKKFRCWLLLRKNGYYVWTEAIFKNTLARPDLLTFKNGIWKIIEVLQTETEKELIEKIKKYPEGIEIIKIKDYSDIVLSNFE